MKTKRVGRPALHGTKMQGYQVRLDKPTVAKARKLGQGNLSKGIRDKFAEGGK